MTQIRAKFHCESVTKRHHYDKTKGFVYDVSLKPITGGSGENDSFYEATPAGEIKIESTTCDAFVPGKDYYVDFTPAD